MISDDDVDIDEFLATIHGNKPPYTCPFSSCSKVFRSYAAIQKHMETAHKNLQEFEICEIDIVNDENKNPSHNDCTKLKTTSKIVTENVQLSYADSKKFVSLQNEKKSFRCNISLPMSVEIKDSPIKQKASSINEENCKVSNVDENSNDTPQSEINNSIIKRKSFKRKRAFSIRSFRKVRKITNETPQTPTALLTNKIGGELKRHPLPLPIFHEDENFEELTKKIPCDNEGLVHFVEKSVDELNEMVEYDLDEEDLIWLPMCNKYLSSLNSSKPSNRKLQKLKVPSKTRKSLITQQTMEFVIDRFEKECHFESHHQKVDEDAVCDICLDGSCENSNAILFCDVCNLAVHQECYGVPFVPEGQWLCRKCLHSPSQSIDCCLCPNKGGAFKQTTDNRWAHVVCALWIPEVRFANIAFLEPIEEIEKIEAARWKLTCYLCKQKNVGACIQCHKSSCYTAFHVTCAQHAGLYMVIEHKDKSCGASGVRKTTYCDVHSPSDFVAGMSRSMYMHSDDEIQSDKSERRQKHLKDVRKQLNQRQNYKPPDCFPIITPDKLETITENLNIPHKKKFIERIHSYWKLKRELRRGVPLLRRLVASSRSNQSYLPLNEENSEMRMSLKFWQQLRQDLEKARLLSELSRKREKIKRELFRNFVSVHEILSKPYATLLTALLNELESKDDKKIFAKPVTDSIAPNYSILITNPMDFSTMQQKMKNNEYYNIDQVNEDFQLMMNNCQKYNAKGTVFYNAAIRMTTEGRKIFDKYLKHFNNIGINSENGLFRDNNFYDKVINLDNLDATINFLESDLAKDELAFQQSNKDHLEKSQINSQKKVKKRGDKLRKRNILLKKEEMEPARTKSVYDSSRHIPTDDEDGEGGRINDSLYGVTSPLSFSGRVLRKMPATSSSCATTGLANSSDSLNGIGGAHSVREDESSSASWWCRKTRSSTANTGNNTNTTSSNGSVTRGGVSSTIVVADHPADSTVGDCKIPKHLPTREPTRRSQRRLANNISHKIDRSSSSYGGNSVDELSDSNCADTCLDYSHYNGNRFNNSHPDRFNVYDVVWVKIKLDLWFPGIIAISDQKHDMVTELERIPIPPIEILKQSRSSNSYLIMLFDKSRSWEWVDHNKLQLLGMNELLDCQKLRKMGRSNKGKAIQRAYRSAVRESCIRNNEKYPYESDDDNYPDVKKPYVLSLYRVS